MTLLLETERLQLCYMSLDDAPFLLRLLNMPSYYRFVGDRGVRTLEQAQHYIRERTLAAYERFGFGYYIVKHKENNASLGMTGLMKRDELEQVDIGFAFLEHEAGKGYGYEAASALMLWASREKGITAFAGIVQDDNPASMRLLEKLGLRLAKTIKINDEELLLYLTPSQRSEH